MRVSLLHWLLIALVSGPSVAHDGLAQPVLNREVTIRLTNLPLKEAIAQLQTQTQVLFVFSSRIGLDKRVTLVADNEKLSSVLDRLLNPLRINYRVINDQIALSRQSAKVTMDVPPLEPLPTGSSVADITIRGTVTDGETNAGLPGVSVLVKDANRGATTDASGNYQVLVPSPETVLVFSYVGYDRQEIRVGTQSVLNVALKAAAGSLNEVVVVGYGIRKKSDLTGSVAQVTSKDFKDQPVTRLEEALQGRASGVLVSRSSGSPGGDVKVRIRGVNSITGNNEPLVVVDGVIGFRLNSINPNDIESMEVLKDASATAIYGSRGSNGVILVTTKRGTSTPRVDLDAFTGFATVPKYIGILGAADFARIENSRRVRTGGTAIFTDGDIAALQASGGTDYQRALFQTGRTDNIQLSTSGKSGKLAYFMSGNYVNQEGIVIKTGYKRLSGRLNISSEINTRLKIGFNMFASRETWINEVGGAGGSSSILEALTWDPTTPVRNAQGVYNNYSLRALANLGYNPIASRETNDLIRIDDNLNTNVNLSYKILPKLDFTAVAGFGTSNSTNERYFTTPPLPSALFNSDKSYGLQLSNILTYERDFGKHNVKLTGLYEIQQSDYRGSSYSASNILVPGGFYLAELAAGKNLANDYRKSAIESFMGRAEYIYDDRFFITGTVRRDKSSRFRDNRNVGIFPSVSFAYNLSSLPVLANNSTLSNLKLRAGWGQVGNQEVAPYSTYPSVNISGGYPFGGSVLTPGSRPDGYSNVDLSWETTSQYNVGLDVGLISNRINLTLDVYQKNTTDLLLNVPVPNFAGGGSVLRNVGEVENKGVDLGISGSIVNTKNLRWDATVSISKFRNKVVSLDGRTEIGGNFFNLDGSGRALNIIQQGQPLGQFYGETFLGTWKTAEADQARQFGAVPGDSKYLTDASGNIVLQAIGNGTPGFIWGFNNTITYRNFDLNVFINGLGQYQILNVTNGTIVGGTGEQRSYMSPSQLNQWTPQNETDIPAGGQNRTASSRYVENGAFARLNNVSLGYTFKKIPGIQSLKVYASGQNLLLITGFSGYDPENSDDGRNNDVASGVQAGTYPNPRTVTLGVKVGF